MIDRIHGKDITAWLAVIVGAVVQSIAQPVTREFARGVQHFHAVFAIGQVGEAVCARAIGQRSANHLAEIRIGGGCAVGIAQHHGHAIHARAGFIRCAACAIGQRAISVVIFPYRAAHGVDCGSFVTKVLGEIGFTSYQAQIKHSAFAVALCARVCIGMCNIYQPTQRQRVFIHLHLIFFSRIQAIEQIAPVFIGHFGANQRIISTGTSGGFRVQRHGHAFQAFAQVVIIAAV